MSGQVEKSAGTAQRTMSLRAADGGKPRLLLAEDSDPVRIVTAAMLKGMGCDVEAVVHGEHAVRFAAEARFDVIVLDIEMPVMDGITAARSIRQMSGPVRETPLMALSAFLADSMRTGQWRDTFDIALPKPANRNELREAVMTALCWQKPLDGQSQSMLPPVIDGDQVTALRAGIAAAIWDQLAETACRDIEVCQNQLEYVKTGQQDGIILVFATKLAGLGRSFAAPRLVWAAGRVQSACSEAGRKEAMETLLCAARETVAALRSG